MQGPPEDSYYNGSPLRDRAHNVVPSRMRRALEKFFQQLMENWDFKQNHTILKIFKFSAKLSYNILEN